MARYTAKNKDGWGLLYGTLDRLPGETTKAARRQLRREAELVEDVAKKMAPVDFGDIENSIGMYQLSFNRDSKGRFTADQFVIGVDPNYVCKDPRDGQKKRAGDYVIQVHEYLPWGTAMKVPRWDGVLWGLGEKSLAKQAQVAPYQVGGGFMWRAFEEVNQGNEIAHRVRDAVYKEIQRYFKKK